MLVRRCWLASRWLAAPHASWRTQQDAAQRRGGGPIGVAGQLSLQQQTVTRRRYVATVCQVAVRHQQTAEHTASGTRRRGERRGGGRYARLHLRLELLRTG